MIEQGLFAAVKADGAQRLTTFAAGLPTRSRRYLREEGCDTLRQASKWYERQMEQPLQNVDAREVAMDVRTALASNGLLQDDVDFDGESNANMRIDHTELSNQTKNALRKANLLTLGELLSAHRHLRDRIPVLVPFSQRSINEVSMCLRNYGLIAAEGDTQ